MTPIRLYPLYCTLYCCILTLTLTRRQPSAPVALSFAFVSDSIFKFYSVLQFYTASATNVTALFTCHFAFPTRWGGFARPGPAAFTASTGMVPVPSTGTAQEVGPLTSSTSSRGQSLGGALWRAGYAPGDCLTSWVYSTTFVYISCYLSENKPVLSYLLLRLLPQCCYFRILLSTFHTSTWNNHKQTSLSMNKTENFILITLSAVWNRELGSLFLVVEGYRENSSMISLLCKTSTSFFIMFQIKPGTTTFLLSFLLN